MLAAYLVRFEIFSNLSPSLLNPSVALCSILSSDSNKSSSPQGRDRRRASCLRKSCQYLLHLSSTGVFTFAFRSFFSFVGTTIVGGLIAAISFSISFMS